MKCHSGRAHVGKAAHNESGVSKVSKSTEFATAAQTEPFCRYSILFEASASKCCRDDDGPAAQKLKRTPRDGAKMP
jgi:hypothetical protein